MTSPSTRLAVVLAAVISLTTMQESRTMFGMPTSRSAFVVNLVLCGCDAYRTQLFLYLKACGENPPHRSVGLIHGEIVDWRAVLR